MIGKGVIPINLSQISQLNVIKEEHIQPDMYDMEVNRIYVVIYKFIELVMY